ncbi:MAG: radical SAM protein [Actinobacteria bacterium]|nr:radical SAM protein [Cyanobacteriota bacterium]MCL5771246.1 radical SAM protein [Actinomycetota bacterium]
MKKIKYLLRLILIYFTFIFKKQTVSYLPVKLWVEISARCNLRCRLCVNKDMPEDTKGDMDFVLFKKIIDEAKDYVFDINLFHRGESLINPYIVEMVEYARKNKIKTRLHTNGTLLNPELSERLIKAGLNFISFSFDGYTPKTYEKNRIGATYDVTLNNIKEFLKIKKRLNSSMPFTQLQVMEYDEDISQKQFAILKESFLKNFEGLSLNKFVIRTPHNWGGSLKITGIGIKNKNTKSFTSSCTFPWYALTIFFDGKVYPCPQDFYGEILVGDVNKDSLRTIFNNEIMRSLRRSFRNSKTVREHPCSNCDRCRRKTLLGIPKEYMGMFLKDSLKKE